MACQARPIKCGTDKSLIDWRLRNTGISIEPGRRAMSNDKNFLCCSDIFYLPAPPYNFSSPLLLIYSTIETCHRFFFICRFAARPFQMNNRP